MLTTAQLQRASPSGCTAYTWFESLEVPDQGASEVAEAGLTVQVVEERLMRRIGKVMR